MLAMPFFTGCSNDEPVEPARAAAYGPEMPQQPPDAYRSTAEHPAAPSGYRRVTIVDRGLQMPRGTRTIPSDWQLTQDVATDPRSGEVARYHVELRGPRGELIKGFAPARYGSMLGTSFDQVLRQMTQHGLGAEINGLTIGELGPSPTLERIPEFQRAAALVQRQGMQLQALEAPLMGQRNGSAVRGRLYVGHFTSGTMPGTGMVQASAVVSPPEVLAEALRIYERMEHSYRSNPAFEQRLQVAQVAFARDRVERPTRRPRCKPHRFQLGISVVKIGQPGRQFSPRPAAHQRVQTFRLDAFHPV